MASAGCFPGTRLKGHHDVFFSLWTHWCLLPTNPAFALSQLWAILHNTSASFFLLDMAPTPVLSTCDIFGVLGSDLKSWKLFWWQSKALCHPSSQQGYTCFRKPTLMVSSLCYYDLNQLETEVWFLTDHNYKYGNRDAGAYFQWRMYINQLTEGNPHAHIWLFLPR